MPVVRGSCAARRSALAPAPVPAATGMLRVQSMLSEHRRWRQAPGKGTDPPRWEDEVMPAVTVDDILPARPLIGAPNSTGSAVRASRLRSVAAPVVPGQAYYNAAEGVRK